MPTEMHSTAELDHARNRKIQSRELIAERVGGAIFGVILLCAALGFLGPGPLTFRQTLSSDNGISISHYLVERIHAPAELRIRFRPPSEPKEYIRIAISRSFTDEITPEAITPEPYYVDLQHDRLVYNFRTPDLRDAGYIRFRYQNEKFGWLRYQIRLEDGPEVQISQFVCP